MSRGVNKVILLGNVGQDPETRSTPSGATATTIRVATSEQWTDKASGEKKEATEWHTVVMWNRLAEVAAQYLRKGSKVYIEGRLRTRKWQDKQGNDRYSTEIIANEMQMVGSSRNGPTAPEGEDAGTGDEPQRASTGRTAAAAPAPFDDDIPF